MFEAGQSVRALHSQQARPHETLYLPPHDMPHLPSMHVASPFAGTGHC
jgi:hypothetical protein